MAAIGLTEGVQAASMIAQTISGIIDQGKRRNFEQAIALLSNQQQKELNNKLLAAQTESQRLQILSDSIVTYAAANAKAKQNKQVIMYIIVGFLAVAVLGAAIFIGSKKSTT